jgi:lambda repressor-like predicted transcriptional regulator
VNSVAPDLHQRVAHLLERAVAESGKSQAAIAREAGMKRDTLRRSLSGGRLVPLVEVVAILDASGLDGEQTVLFLLLGSEHFALNHCGSAAAQFLGELFCRRRNRYAAWR